MLNFNTVALKLDFRMIFQEERWMGTGNLEYPPPNKSAQIWKETRLQGTDPDLINKSQTPSLNMEQSQVQIPERKSHNKVIPHMFPTYNKPNMY